MEFISNGLSSIYQFKRIYKILSIIGIAISFLLFFYVVIFQDVNILLSILFFGPLIKMCESVLIYKITIDTKNKTIKLRRTFGTSELLFKKIGSYTIRKLENNSVGSSRLSKRRFLELTTIENEKHIYPLPAQKSFSPYILWSDKELENIFNPLGKSQGSEYLSSIGYKSLQYDYNFLLL